MQQVDYLTRDGVNTETAGVQAEEDQEEADMKILSMQGTETSRRSSMETEESINSIVIQYGDIENVDWSKSQMEDMTLRVIRNWVLQSKIPDENLI